ncbi:hypothetical protein EB796_016704 [Bugula neritina]|uniref:Uncharacterized protein n=1 Tax=Bugula neritina TaxID=10212 RepID=A0A7J7JHB9_BUGNE|nr:hypothetical protein EB796_016704 [Bugula neritina]
MSTTENIQSGKREVYLRFLLGGLSNGTGSAVMHPMDTMKVRLQLDNELSAKTNNIFKDRYYKGVFRGCYRVISEEGIRALYRG